EANIYSKKLWVLSQNMSKAYDSVHIPLLKKALARIKLPKAIINLITDIFTNKHNIVITNHGTKEPYPNPKDRINHPVLAYMEDMTWIASSKQQLEKILTIATTFYSFTNIRVNTNKSVLAILNHTDPPSITFNNITIESIKPKQAFRFL
ncbi:13090_t:CDS:2, partial [Ambispora leptoticha]